MNVQIDLFVLWIHFHHEIGLQRMLPDEEYFYSIKTIGFEDSIMNKNIIMRRTVDEISKAKCYTS